MNQITQTTKTAIDTIKTHALLSKALSNDPKPTPGYLFPEITRLTQAPGTSSIVLTYILKIITPNGSSASSNAHGFTGGSGGNGVGGSMSSAPSYTNSPHVLLKALKILRQLAQSGSVEFRVNLARRGKGPLAEMVGYRGQWDDVHGDKFNQDVRTVAEELLEYMHSNPIEEPEIPENIDELTERESAVLQNSTQNIQGFGNPEYDDSDSEDEPTIKGIRKSSDRKKSKAAPPLPGFGNPAFEKEDDNSEPTLMSRLADKLQEMTAPPPPIAMRAAYRQQEQRRQKLFVGEYSMRPDTHGRTKEGTITMMGTNPFKRTSRVQGVAAGGWGDRAADISGAGAKDYLVNRNFPLPYSGARTMQFRNKLSENIYELSQHIQTDIVRSKLQSQLFSNCEKQPGDLMDTLDLSIDPKDNGDRSVILWGVANEISNVVVEYLENEQSSQLADITLTDSTQKVSTMTGLLRDVVDWIEQEDWERRIRYLFIVDVFLTSPKIEEKLLECPAFPLLSKTLSGPACLESPQRSVQVLSTQLAHQVKRAFNGSSRTRTAQTLSSGKFTSVSMSKMSLLDIGS